MAQYLVPMHYQVFYVLVPTISIIGNSCVVYVTIRSRSLRSPCEIFIVLISFGEILHMFAHYIMVVSHNCFEDHQIRQDFCTYWQIFPLLGLFFSSMLLLNVAVDRVLSTRKFYKHIIEKYYVPYTTTHIFSATLFTLVMGAFAFDNRTADLMVTCIITMAIRGVARLLFLVALPTIYMLMMICYVLLMCLIRKIQLNHDSTRQIHRSLLVISSTMVFGWVSAMILQMVTKIPGLHFERLHVDLLAGLFVTSASASNFFVYYTISKKYRNLFDKYLFIRRFKKGFLSCAPNATVDVLILANRIKENPQV